MALDTYSNLETAVATWLGRAGDSNITGNIADAITLLEARLAYGSGDAEDPDQSYYTAPLRIRAMEKPQAIIVNAVTDGGTVGGTANAITLTPSDAIASYALGQTWSFTATASNTGATTVEISGVTPARSVKKGSALSDLASGDIVDGQKVQLYDDGTELVYMPGTANAPLPSNYLAMRSAYLDTNPRQPLEYITPAQANLRFSAQAPAQPTWFTIEGDAIRLYPAPDTAYAVMVNYYEKFGALSSATNWLLTNAPNVYLYGTLLEIAILLYPDDMIARYLRLFRAACNGLQAQDERDRHSGGALTIRNATITP